MPDWSGYETSWATSTSTSSAGNGWLWRSSTSTNNTTEATSATTMAAVVRHALNECSWNQVTTNNTYAFSQPYESVWRAEPAWWRDPVRQPQPRPSAPAPDRNIVERLARASRLRSMINGRRSAAKAAQADRRAIELLCNNLSPQQRREFHKRRCVFVHGASGRRYMIVCRRKAQHNVFEVDASGHRRIEFCAHLCGNIPLADQWLAQKLMLECDEAGFRRVANAWRLDGSNREPVARIDPMAGLAA